MTQPSNFTARADSAALALKAQLSAQHGKEIAPRSVPVGPNGQPAPPPPPEGSYAQQIRQRQMQAAAERQAAMQQMQATAQQLSQQDQPQEPVGSQVVDQQQPQPNDQLSPNAQRRFSELSQTLRQKDQELQQALARSKQLEETYAQTQARLAAIEANYNNLVNQSLDSLDPETRQQVLQRAAIDEAAAAMEQRIMQRIAPVAERVQTQAIQAELMQVAQRYPAFSVDLHGPLIEAFRRQNPNCTIEQAFRAVAEPEELAVGGRARAPAVPPIAIQHQSNASPRYMPQPSPQQKTIEQEIEEDRQRAFALAKSSDPMDRRLAGPAMDAYIARKLGNRLPGRR